MKHPFEDYPELLKNIRKCDGTELKALTAAANVIFKAGGTTEDAYAAVNSVLIAAGREPIHSTD